MTKRIDSAPAVPVQPYRVTDPDGAIVEALRLPPDEAVLHDLLAFLFQEHWNDIVFGPIVEGAAYEWRPDGPPRRMGMRDGYLTVHFGRSHFHLCIGPHKGPAHSPTPPALARRRQVARAELFRRLERETLTPLSWGLRLFNGAGEQQITIFFPNPFLDDALSKVLKKPDWSKLALWDAVCARWLGAPDADPFDRSGRGFRHG